MRLIKPLTVWALLCPMLSHAANLTSLETNYFQVVGYDNRSVSYVSELAEHIATQANRYLPDNGVSFPQPIFIALRPEDQVDFEGHSVLQLTQRSGVNLDFRWDESLTLKQTCFAITQAFLTRYAIYQYGPSAPSAIKAWPVHALALESLHSLRPTLLVSHLKASKNAEFVDVNTLMSEPLSASLDDNFSDHAYYFLYALRQNTFERDTIRLIIENTLAGGDPSEGINKFLGTAPGSEEAITVDTWWQTQRDELFTVDYELFEAMTDSRVWMEQMANFDVYREAGGAMKNIRSLWALRDDVKIRSILEARIELISLRLEIINPLYFNAARSLGALYEIALDPDTASYQFMHALVAYLGDLDNAKKIEEITLNFLDKK